MTMKVSGSRKMDKETQKEVQKPRGQNIIKNVHWQENGQDLKRNGIPENVHKPQLKFSLSEEEDPRRGAKKPMG